MRIYYRLVALIIKDKKLLMVKGKGYPELWTPGGKVDPEETEEEALKRELKEELNLKLKSMKFFKEYFLKNPYTKDMMTKSKVFLVKVEGKIKPGMEIESVVWVDKKDFIDKKYVMLEAEEKFLIPDLIKENLL